MTDATDLDVRLEVADGAARLELVGPFTARTAVRVRAALEIVSVARAGIVVDLAGVTELDDAARRLLDSARRAARREGWRFEAVGDPAWNPAGRRVAAGDAQAGGPDASRTIVTKRTSKPARS